MDLFVIKCEHIISNDADATQVIGKFTPNQRHNLYIIKALNHLSCQLKNLFNSLDDSLPNYVETSLKSIDDLILNILNPFIESIQFAIQDIILTIHNEKYSANELSQSSLYMRELQGFISRVSQDYFGQYPDSELIRKKIHQTTAFVIDFFLLQICLVRPVSPQGRKKILQDFSQLEIAISPICQRTGDIGKSFQILKAFKTLLLLSPEEICKSPIIGDPIPYYLIIHFLISNFATDELKSPFDYKGWSISRYTKWIMEKRDFDKLEIVNETLNSYLLDVKRSQKKSYIHLYPFLMDLIKRASN